MSWRGRRKSCTICGRTFTAARKKTTPTGIPPWQAESLLHKNIGIVVFAHGSRVESANEAVRRAAEGMARAGGYEHVEAAFLELGTPDLAGAADRLVAAGVVGITIVPYFLTLGMHMERDLPVLVAAIE